MHKYTAVVDLSHDVGTGVLKEVRKRELLIQKKHYKKRRIDEKTK